MLRSDRKADHLRIAAAPGVEHRRGTGLESVRLCHRALPGRDLDAVALTARVLGRELAAPLLISAMTGGVAEAGEVNGRLLAAAAEHGIGITLGSGRRLLEDPTLLATYRPGGAPRPPLLLANLGAAQVAGAGGPAHAERLVELLEADGLSVHLNPLQEAVQPEGDVAFGGVLDGIARLVVRLAPRPVVVKEVGFGLCGADVALLHGAGVAAVDVAGAGGTNWALVEGRRDERSGRVAAAFDDWGLATAEALAEAAAAAPELPRIASGGLRDGVDCAKCIVLGASACALARPLLPAARADRVGEALATVLRQLRIATWLTGAPSAAALGAEHLA
ncbi:MAG TPA: type 2 isopentenyl-diphosphate Delta-isomerase [Solirubrobacteraceae bacterium]|jgi:isopentenyl-diphosphate delta-isomerase